MHVLVISGSSALATIVATGGHDVTEARLGDAKSWPRTGDVPAADVVLLDVPISDLASNVSALLNALDSPPAQVVIEPGDADWPAGDVDADVRLRTPIGRDTVLTALDTAWAQRHQEQPESSTEAGGATSATSTSEASDRLLGPVGPPVGVDEQAARLTRVADGLLSAAEVAASVVEAAADALDAEAAAMLCPDDDEWSVVGGFGTRSLELRVSLQPDHWLIHNLLLRQRGAIIDGSDIARSQLANAPLASRDHLVIVSDEQSKSLLIVGRNAAPFTQQDLEHAHDMLQEASPFLVAALAMHDLARSLDRFRELR